MSATASEAKGRRHAREVPKRLRCAAFRGRPSGPSLPNILLSTLNVERQGLARVHLRWRYSHPQSSTLYSSARPSTCNRLGEVHRLAAKGLPVQLGSNARRRRRRLGQPTGYRGVDPLDNPVAKIRPVKR